MYVGGFRTPFAAFVVENNPISLPIVHSGRESSYIPIYHPTNKVSIVMRHRYIDDYHTYRVTLKKISLTRHFSDNKEKEGSANVEKKGVQVSICGSRTRYFFAFAQIMTLQLTLLLFRISVDVLLIDLSYDEDFEQIKMCLRENELDE